MVGRGRGVLPPNFAADGADTVAELSEDVLTPPGVHRDDEVDEASLGVAVLRTFDEQAEVVAPVGRGRAQGWHAGHHLEVAGGRERVDVLE